MKLFKDPRDYQIIFLSGFLLYGILYLNWGDRWENLAAYFSGAILTQTALIRFFNLPTNSLKSAWISALGLSLLLQTGHPGFAFIAAVFAIGSKSLFRSKGKHIFNPANAGIMLLLVTGVGWVSPGQWGHEGLLILAFTASAWVVLAKVNQAKTSVVFLLTLLALDFVRGVLYLGWSPDVVLHSFSNGSLLLFAFFMITDPRTVPNHPRAQIYWAFTLALVVFALSRWFYFQTGMIWALFGFCALTPFINSRAKHTVFQWIKTNK
jgi:Na+-transporting NADH:ubiquinone oxidoreductase subunit NqrB